MATAFEPLNRSLETFLTRLSRTNERSEKSRRVFKKPRCYKDESDGCIDTWIEVMKLHFEEEDLSERQECSALTSNLEGTALNCVMATKQYQRDTAEKIFEIFPWFRATLTSWLYMVTKDHMRKYQKEYRQFQAEIGPEAFMRPLLTHRNAIMTGWKRVGRVSRNNTKARELILEEDLAKNVSLSVQNSFCLNRESRVKNLPNQAKRLQEQREWMRSYEQLKAWEEIVISSDDEEALLRQITVSNTSGSGTSKTKNAR